MGSRKLEWAIRGDRDRIGRVESERFAAVWIFVSGEGQGNGGKGMPYQTIPSPPFPCRSAFFRNVGPITPSVIQRFGFLPFFAFERTAAA